LVDLSKQWLDTETTEDKHAIERQLLYFRSNIPSDSYIDQKFEEGTNKVLAGVIGQLALHSVGASEEELNCNINELDKSEGCYIIGQVNSRMSSDIINDIKTKTP